MGNCSPPKDDVYLLFGTLLWVSHSKLLLLTWICKVQFLGYQSLAWQKKGYCMVLGLGLNSSHSSFLVLPDSAMVLQEFKKSWKPCHSFSFLSSCSYQVRGLAMVHKSIQSLWSLSISWTAICLQGFARAVTMPVTPELTLDKQENLSLNLRDEGDIVKIKILAI